LLNISWLAPRLIHRFGEQVSVAGQKRTDLFWLAPHSPAFISRRHLPSSYSNDAGTQLERAMPMKSKKAVKGRTYNREQKEGIAKILDGIAQAFIIGTTVGSIGFTEHKISAITAGFILLMSLALIYVACLIRGSKEFRNVR
jgi:hypothetical protein